MEDFPGYVAAWADAKQLFDSLHDLWVDVDKLASAQAKVPSGEISSSRQLVLEQLLRLEELLRQPRFVAASMHWGEYDEANDHWGVSTGTSAEHALFSYFREVRLLIDWCRSFLFDLNLRTKERNIEFWPRSARFIWSIRFGMEAIVNSFQELPEVRAELLRLARGSAQPERSQAAENTLDGADKGPDRADRADRADKMENFPADLPPDEELRQYILQVDAEAKKPGRRKLGYKTAIARKIVGNDGAAALMKAANRWNKKRGLK